MRSLARLALGIVVFAVAAPALLYVCFLITLAIGFATDSGALGICGPYGPLGGVLLVALLAGAVGTVVVAFIVARRVVNRVLPAVLVFDNLSPSPHDSRSH